MQVTITFDLFYRIMVHFSEGEDMKWKMFCTYIVFFFTFLALKGGAGGYNCSTPKHNWAFHIANSERKVIYRNVYRTLCVELSFCWMLGGHDFYQGGVLVFALEGQNPPLCL